MLQAPPVAVEHIVSDVLPFLAGVIVLVAGMVALRWFLRSPMAEALAERMRLRTRQRFGAAASGGDAARIAALEEQVAELERRLAELVDLEGQVAELVERVDFSERLLAKQREAERLGPPPR